MGFGSQLTHLSASNALLSFVLVKLQYGLCWVEQWWRLDICGRDRSAAGDLKAEVAAIDLR